MNIRIRSRSAAAFVPALALGAALAGLPARAQDPVPEKAPPAAQAPQQRAEDAVKQLGSDTFRERQQAESALRQLGKDALPELRKAAEESKDAEVQWRARRLIRQIEEGAEAGLAPRDAGAVPQPAEDRDGPLLRRGTRPSFPGVPEDMQRRFDELFRSLEQDFGMDIPRARFFDDSFFKDLQQQMDDVQQQLRNAPFGEGRSMSMQMGPDGVRVEVKTKNDKGEEETKVYEAPDLQTFREKHPGVLDGAGFGGGGFTFTLPNGGFRGFAQGMPQLRGLAPRILAPDAGQLAPTDVPPPEHKRLGVTVRNEVSQDLLEHLGLEGALCIDAVQPGTLAESLGLRAGDLLVRIAGKAIANTADVQDALGSVAAGAEVEVVVYRKGAETALRAKKPEPKGEDAASPLQKRTKDDGAQKDESGKR